MTATLNHELAIELDAFLQLEHEVLSTWGKAVRDMRTAMLQGRLAEGTACLQSHNTLLTQQSRRRKQLQQRLAEALRIPVEEISLSKLEPYVDEFQYRRIIERRSAIQKQLQEIRTTTNANAALILQMGDVLKQVFQVISNSHAPHATYNAAGKLVESSFGLHLKKA